jgi:amidase
LSVDGELTPYGDQLAWPGLATVAGLPASVAPAGRSKEGLPIGVQIIGPWQEDRTTLALAGIVGQLRR